MDSILQNKKYCLICGTEIKLHKHHVYAGNPNRKKSEENGCWCWLCQYHHTGDGGVHQDPDLDRALKQRCQNKFEATHSREEFIKIFGKSWL